MGERLGRTRKVAIGAGAVVTSLLLFTACSSGSDDTASAGSASGDSNGSDDSGAEVQEQSVYENFGTFERVKKAGNGDSVVKLGDAASATAVAVTASHKGSSNFALEALDSENETTDLLVNEIGNYSGTTFLAVDDVKKLKVTADGGWSVKLKPIADLGEVTAPFKGAGDEVVLYSGDTADWKIKHNGESNFAVQQLNEDGQDLLVNEIGDYSGVIPASAGPSIVIIGADGNWSFKDA